MGPFGAMFRDMRRVTAQLVLPFGLTKARGICEECGRTTGELRWLWQRPEAGICGRCTIRADYARRISWGEIRAAEHQVKAAEYELGVAKLEDELANLEDDWELDDEFEDFTRIASA